jgi:hypothetical protein
MHTIKKKFPMYFKSWFTQVGSKNKQEENN